MTKKVVNTNMLKESFKILGRGGKSKGIRYVRIKDNKLSLLHEIYNDLKLTSIEIDLGLVESEDIQLEIKNTKEVEKAMKFFENKDTVIAYENELQFKNGDKILLADIEEASLSNIDNVSGSEYIFTPNLKERLESLLPMASKDGFRPILEGIIFDENNLVALDGYKLGLHRAQTKDKNRIAKGDSFVISGQASKSLLDILKITKNQKDIILNKEGRCLEFTIGNITLRTEIEDGSIINYKEILNHKVDSTGKIELSLEKLEKSIKFIESVAPFVRLIDNKMIGFTKADTGKYKYNKVGVVELEKADIEGDISLDSKKFKDLVMALKKGVDKKENIEITMYGRYNPLFFRVKDEFEYILLPIRLSNDIANIK